MAGAITSTCSRSAADRVVHVGRTNDESFEPDYSIRREFVDGHVVRLSRTADDAYRKSLGKGSGRGSALPAQSVNSVIVMS